MQRLFFILTFFFFTFPAMAENAPPAFEMPSTAEIQNVMRQLENSGMQLSPELQQQMAMFQQQMTLFSQFESCLTPTFGPNAINTLTQRVTANGLQEKIESQFKDFCRSNVGLEKNSAAFFNEMSDTFKDTFSKNEISALTKCAEHMTKAAEAMYPAESTSSMESPDNYKLQNPKSAICDFDSDGDM